MRVPGSVKHDLTAEIAAAGYFPELVQDSVLAAAGDETVVDFVVHHEPTFDGDEIHRHLTVVLLTPSRLVIGHTDDHPGDEQIPGPYATTSTESVRLSAVTSVVLTQVVSQPEAYQPGRKRSLLDHGSTSAVQEAWLTVGWGAMRRLDLEPAGCSDPQCDADHGYTGTVATEDLSIRKSSGIEGLDRVQQLMAFAHGLQRATGG